MIDPLSDAKRRAFSIPDRRPIWEWAVDNVAMPPGLAKSVFDPNISRHFLPIFDALQDDRVRQVVIRKPVGGGGTLISDIWHCWTRANDPGRAMAILQTDDIAKTHFKERLRYMMLRSPSVRGLLPDSRHDITSSEILFKDGLSLHMTGPSIKQLQTKRLRYISCDEVWCYDPGTVQEAEGRLSDFVKMGLSKLLLISQGSVEDDDFDRRDKESSCEEWRVGCLHCNARWFPLFKHEVREGAEIVLRGTRWDTIKDDKGFWNVAECIQTVRYECPACGHPHTNWARTRSEWNRIGDYLQTNPKADKSLRSFHWPGTIDWQWTELVKLYLNARNAYRMGMMEPTIQFWQKYIAEPKSEKTVLNEGLEFKRVVVTEETPDEMIRVLACDRQSEGLYWASAHSITKDGTLKCIWFGKLFSGAAIKKKADDLKCDNVLIDSGFEAKGPQGVYSICARYHSREQHWIATKGSPEKSFYHTVGKGRRVTRSYSENAKGDPEIGRTGEGNSYAILVRLSSDVFDERLDHLIANGKFQAMDCAESEMIEYKRQLSARYKKRKTDKFSGKITYEYVCPTNNDHLRDCAKQAVLAATMAGVLPDQDLV